MSKTKKLLAAALAVLAFAAASPTSTALTGSGDGARLACGTSGSSSCG